MMDIIYEDNSIIVIYKPAGLAAQTANVAQPDCVSLIREHIRKTDPGIKKEPYVGIIHRLDQPVAGLLVFAKDRSAAAKLSQQVQSDMMNKHYMAMVEGIVDAPSDVTLVDSMYKDASAGRAVIADIAPGNARIREAALIYHTDRILEKDNKTILSIQLVTGRFHQIRAQLSHMGHPIVGDRKYGAVTAYPTGIALVADRISFTHPDSGEKVEKAVDFSFAL